MGYGRRGVICKMKKGGFSYVEIIIALAVLTIALAPVFPALAAARKNSVYAEDTYIAKQQAHGIALAIKGALEEEASTEQAASAYVEGLINPPYAYDFWVLGSDETENGAAPSQPVLGESAKTVAVAVWNEEGHLIGRAVLVYAGNE